MTPVQFYGGKVLFTPENKIAMHPRCCCDHEPSPPSWLLGCDAFWARLSECGQLLSYDRVVIPHPFVVSIAPSTVETDLCTALCQSPLSISEFIHAPSPYGGVCVVGGLGGNYSDPPIGYVTWRQIEFHFQPWPPLMTDVIVRLGAYSGGEFLTDVAYGTPLPLDFDPCIGFESPIELPKIEETCREEEHLGRLCCGWPDSVTIAVGETP